MSAGEIIRQKGGGIAGVLLALAAGVEALGFNLADIADYAIAEFDTLSEHVRQVKAAFVASAAGLYAFVKLKMGKGNE